MAVCCLALAHSPSQITVGLESKLAATNQRVWTAQHYPTVQMAAILKYQVVFGLELCCANNVQVFSAVHTILQTGLFLLAPGIPGPIYVSGCL